MLKLTQQQPIQLHSASKAGELAPFGATDLWADTRRPKPELAAAAGLGALIVGASREPYEPREEEK